MVSVVQYKHSCDLDKSDAPIFERDISGRNLPLLRSHITVVWLDDSQHSSSNENITQIHTLLRNNRCSILFYSTVGKCIKYLKQARSREYVIVVIISYPIDVIHKMVYRLRQYRVVQAIYMVSSERNPIDGFSPTVESMTVFENKNVMIDRLDSLLDDIQKVNFEGGLFSTFSRKERALNDIRREQGAFVWNHVLKILVTSMPCNSLVAKQQMLAECRAYYRNDPVQLSHIDDFDREYKWTDAIRWYTKPGFLFFLLNKALRSGDIVAFYTFRYFIKDLYKCFKIAAVAQSKDSFRVYRGAKLHREEVKSLSVGCLVAANSFFSCSRDHRVAEMFIGIGPSIGELSNRDQDESLQNVLFTIDVDLAKYPNTMVADISVQTELSDESEVIFMLDSTFIINQIVRDSEKSIWLIQMSSLHDIAWNDRKHEGYMRRRLEETSSTILFGNALATIDTNYMYSLKYFHRLLRTLPFDHVDRPDIYYNIGRIYRILEKYEKALACFRSAQLLLCRLLPQRMFDYCRALGGVGTVYTELGDFEQAIHFLKKAVILQSKHLPDNHPETPFHFNRLGKTYLAAKQLDSALAILYSADNFSEKRMPMEHHGHGHTLYIMGLVYHALSDVENAYSCFKKALYKQESLLAKDHPEVASVCYQLSLIHESRGKYETALGYANRSLCIRSIKLPYYHSQLKKSRELVERLRLSQKVRDTT